MNLRVCARRFCEEIIRRRLCVLRSRLSEVGTRPVIRGLILWLAIELIVRNQFSE